ncbi:MAG TPA: PAS domain-containing protein, partial [archaeon]|nr:PAS domain-containing protein [archaeon]
MWITGDDDRPLITAIVGGGQACEAILRMVKEGGLGSLRMSIVGVADRNADAPGVRYARCSGVPLITTDYRDLYTIPDLGLIIELTGSDKLRDEIESNRPRHIRLIDHFGARLFWELHQAQQKIMEQGNLLRQQVETERERIAQILDSIPYEILVVDTELAVQHANATFLKHHGVRLENVRGRSYYEVCDGVQGEYETVQVSSAKEALNTKAARSLVRKCFDAKGEMRYFLTEFEPLLSPDGSLRGMIVMTRDISHRILLEEDLKAAEVQLKRFMELAPLATYVKDRQGQYIEVNLATCTLLGREKSAIIGKTDEELLPMAAAKVMRTGDQDVLRFQERLSFDAEVLLGGNPVFLSTIKYPVLDADGNARAVAGLSKDITAQRKAEAELIRTRAYLQNILDNAPMMVITTDLDGRIVSFNRHAETCYGYKAVEILGKPVCMLCGSLCGSPEEWEPLSRHIEQGGTVQEYETIPLRKDGRRMVIALTLAPLKDNDGNMIGIVCLSRDISQRKALMDQVIQSERLASVGRLAAGVAHEINNPMAVIAEIAGYLEDLLAEGPQVKRRKLDRELQEGLPKITAQIKRCRSITSRLLSFARKRETPMEVADVNNSLDEILPFLAKEARLAGVQIHRRFNIDIPLVRIEDVQLEEILINLIKNAIHSMSPRTYGNIWLFATQKDGKVILTVKDDGPGIDKKVMDRLFDPFVTTKPVGQGTGLGLSICYGIVKHHGGEIQVESEPGEGASFRVILPVH